MPHGLTDEEIRELGNLWAVYDHSEELHRFLMGEHRPGDITYVVDSLEYYLDDSALPDKSKVSIYRSLIESLPQCSLNAWWEVLHAIPDDPELWLHVACVVGNTPDEIEADTDILADIVEKVLSADWILERACDDIDRAIKQLLRSLHESVYRS